MRCRRALGPISLPLVTAAVIGSWLQPERGAEEVGEGHDVVYMRARQGRSSAGGGDGVKERDESPPARHHIGLSETSTNLDMTRVHVTR